MVSMGMIFQFDESEGTGRVMLSHGESKEFTLSDWKETETEAKVGLKISYEISETGISIKLFTEPKACVEKIVEDEEVEVKSLQEHIQYFEGMGFKLVGKVIPVDNAKLRRYSMDQHEEINIKASGTDVTVTKTINGKKASL